MDAANRWANRQTLDQVPGGSFAFPPQYLSLRHILAVYGEPITTCSYTVRTISDMNRVSKMSRGKFSLHGHRRSSTRARTDKVESGERIEEGPRNLWIPAARLGSALCRYAVQESQKVDIEERKGSGIGSKARLQSLHFFLLLSRCLLTL